MLTPILTTFISSVILSVVLFVVISKERRHKRRFFAHRVRDWLDRKVDKIGNWLIRTSNHFTKYILQLNWYYSIHSVLKAILRMITAMYVGIENVFEKNRRRTKKLRAEKRQINELNHLHQMAQHKQDTSLTAAEKKRLSKKTLDGKF